MAASTAITEAQAKLIRSVFVGKIRRLRLTQRVFASFQIACARRHPCEAEMCHLQQARCQPLPSSLLRAGDLRGLSIDTPCVVPRLRAFAPLRRRLQAAQGPANNNQGFLTDRREETRGESTQRDPTNHTCRLSTSDCRGRSCTARHHSIGPQIRRPGSNGAAALSSRGNIHQCCTGGCSRSRGGQASRGRRGP